ncbi:MAG: alanine racemase [Candidatus Yanofskybacteria bacterium CG10_big_fil_rev_8_21_14_0_10_36_16]|uniref:Alanine racemase n=1 Tax=Candidatus Yanofskybacteria bacterium CG10_big_fil_rev_8_21_14_0_10_36_16 TaxID=1975096 RepID=A0A2J0Q6U8_9BACT|nr:MAG: alanine racemase [Candidatus Yanofskybacteria bacterium CG10_big_fil_rev_8_21_14_0_10_36_16]
MKTWVEISKSALENNVKAVKKLLDRGTRLMAVVKSNAYGHGPATAGLFSKYGIDWLGVDNIDEALDLRKKGIKKPILVLGYTDSKRFKDAFSNNIDLVVYDSGVFKKIKSNIPKLHLKIDTGMSRQGVLVNNLPSFIKKLPLNINFEGILSHFANADEKDRRFPNKQLDEFKKALTVLNKNNINTKIKHISATTGLLTMPEANFDMVRVGIALYGLWPTIEFFEKYKKMNICPALSWKTKIIQVKDIKKDSCVGYGITEKVRKNTTIAVLPIGYYDGYSRALSSLGEVLIGGKRCRVLGRVSMNLTVVDISSAGNVNIDDEVVLVGRQGKENITAEELAEKVGTISYEIVSRINPLLPRVYVP